MAVQTNRMIRDDGTLTFKQCISDLWIPATDFVASAAGPALEIVDAAHHGMLFDTSSAENVSRAFIAPPYWNAVALTWYTYNPTSGDGGVVMGYYMEDLSSGSSLTSETPTPVADITITCDGSEDEDDLLITQGASIVPVTAGGYNVLKVGRVVDDAADTLAADYALLGVLLTRAA